MRATTLLVISQPAKQAMAFAVSIVLARLLSPADYGLLALGQILVGYLSMFSGFGMYEASVQKEDLPDDEANAVFLLNVLLAIVLFGVSCASAPLIARYFKAPPLFTIIPILSLVFLFSGGSQLHACLLARAERFRAMIGIDLVGQFVAAAAAIAVAACGGGYWALVTLTVLSVAIPGAATWAAAGWRPRRASLAGIRGIFGTFRLGLSISGGNMINYISGQFDRFVLGKYSSIAEVGLYTKSLNLGSYTPNLLFVGPHRYVSARLSRLQGDAEAYRAELHRILSIVLWAAVLLCGNMVVSARGLVSLLFGPRWDAMYLILFWMGIGNAAYILAFAYQWVFVSRGQGAKFVQTNVIKMVITVAACLAGLRWGGVGVAAGYAASVWLLAVYTSAVCAREIGDSPWHFASVLWVPALLALPGCAVAAACAPLSDASLRALIVRSLVFSLIYLGLSRMVVGGTLREVIRIVPWPNVARASTAGEERV